MLGGNFFLVANFFFKLMLIYCETHKNCPTLPRCVCLKFNFSSILSNMPDISAKVFGVSGVIISHKQKTVVVRVSDD